MWYRGISLAAALAAGILPAQAVDFYLSSEDQDVTITNDRLPEIKFTWQRFPPVVGDFNGDKAGDIGILVLNPDSMGEINIILGGSLPKRGSLSGQTAVRILLPAPGESWPFEPVMAFGDLNGDGKKDLFVSLLQGTPARAAVYVFFGSAHPKGTRDLASADVTIPLGSKSLQLAAADLNGDAVEDMAIALDQGRIDIVYGEASFPKGVLDIRDTSRVSVILGGESFGSRPKLVVGRPTTDGRDVLIVSSPELARTYLFWQGTWPARWALASLAPTLTINGGTCVAAGDINGDHIDDLLMEMPSNKFSTSPLAFLNGVDTAGVSAISLQPGSANYRVTTPLALPTAALFSGLGDFDGDDRADLTISDASGYPHHVVSRTFLSSDYPPGRTLPNFGTPSVVIHGPVLGPAMGDVSGDSFQDMVFLSVNEGKASFSIFYGFHPSNPVRQRYSESLDPETLFNEGYNAFTLGEYEKAGDFFGKLLLVQPNHAEGKKWLKKAEEQVSAAKTARLKAEVERARQGERQERARGKKLYAEGVAAYSAGDLKKARTLFREALDLAPGDKRIRRTLERVEGELSGPAK